MKHPVVPTTWPNFLHKQCGYHSFYFLCFAFCLYLYYLYPCPLSFVLPLKGASHRLATLLHLPQISSAWESLLICWCQAEGWIFSSFFTFYLFIPFVSFLFYVYISLLHIQYFNIFFHREPFWDLTDLRTLRNTLRKDPEFHHSDWRQVSEEAKDFIRCRIWLFDDSLLLSLYLCRLPWERASSTIIWTTLPWPSLD